MCIVPLALLDKGNNYEEGASLRVQLPRHSDAQTRGGGGSRLSREAILTFYRFVNVKKHAHFLTACTQQTYRRYVFCFPQTRLTITRKTQEKPTSLACGFAIKLVICGRDLTF